MSLNHQISLDHGVHSCKNKEVLKLLYVTCSLPTLGSPNCHILPVKVLDSDREFCHHELFKVYLSHRWVYSSWLINSYRVLKTVLNLGLESPEAISR